MGAAYLYNLREELQGEETQPKTMAKEDSWFGWHIPVCLFSI